MMWPFKNEDRQRYFSIFLLASGSFFMIYNTSIVLIPGVNNFILGLLSCFIGAMYFMDVG